MNARKRFPAWFLTALWIITSSHQAPGTSSATAADLTSQAAAEIVIRPDPEAVARRHGPFRNDASRGIPDGVRAVPVPEQEARTPQARPPEHAPNSVLVKLRPPDRPLSSPDLARRATQTLIEALGAEIILAVEPLVPAAIKPDRAINALHGPDPRRAQLADAVREHGLDRWHRVRLAPGSQPLDAIRQLKTVESIEVAEPVLRHCSRMP